MADHSDHLEDVLVVDDNPGDVRFIEEALEGSDLDVTVHTANSREEAIEFVTSQRERGTAPRPDVILLDWNLSEATGREVLRAARSDGAPIPVILMTGTQAELEAVRSEVSGASLYLEKPTEPDGYIEAVRSID